MTTTVPTKAWISVPRTRETEHVLSISPYAVLNKNATTWTVFKFTPLLQALGIQGVAGFNTAAALFSMHGHVHVVAPPSSQAVKFFAKYPALEYTQHRCVYKLKSDGMSSAILAAQKGYISDPEHLLPTSPTLVLDAASGSLSIANSDLAQEVFAAEFPSSDVMGVWQQKGLPVAFADVLTREVYHSQVSTPAPPSLKLPLFEYQTVGFQQSAYRRGFLIADTPGLGKTPQGIAVALAAMNEGLQVSLSGPPVTPSRVVVICPAAVRSQWLSELRKFAGIEAIEIAGDSQARARRVKRALVTPRSWSVLHYDILYRDLDTLLPLTKDAFLVLDEVHNVRNPEAQRTIATSNLRAHALGCVGLSGTPMDNRPDELHAVMNLIHPGLLGDRETFQKSYMNQLPGGAFIGYKHLDSLKVRMAPHMVHRTKAEVAPDMPPLQVSSVKLNVDAATRAMLDLVHAKAAAVVRDVSRSKNPMADRRLVQGLLRRACLSPHLLHTSLSPSAQALIGELQLPDLLGVKVEYVRSVLTSFKEAQERCVVFCYSNALVHDMAASFAAEGINSVLFTGAESQKQRDAAVAQFNDPAAPVTAFLATDAAAEGLNLGRCCSTLIQMDVPFTTKTIIQRVNRIHRIDGVAESYQVLNLVIEDTVEDAMLEIIEKKTRMVGSIFKGVSMETTTGKDSSEEDIFFTALATMSL